VLRPLPLRQLGLGPREPEVDLVVQRGLGAHSPRVSPRAAESLPAGL
jgi:hypothetical protein